MNDTKPTTNGGARPNAGRKPLPDSQKRKQRNIFVDEREWVAVRHFIAHTLRGEPTQAQKRNAEKETTAE